MSASRSRTRATASCESAFPVTVNVVPVGAEAPPDGFSPFVVTTALVAFPVVAEALVAPGVSCMVSSQTPCGITRASWSSRPSQLERPDDAAVNAARCACACAATAAETEAAACFCATCASSPSSVVRRSLTSERPCTNPSARSTATRTRTAPAAAAIPFVDRRPLWAAAGRFSTRGAGSRLTARISASTPSPIATASDARSSRSSTASAICTPASGSASRTRTRVSRSSSSARPRHARRAAGDEDLARSRASRAGLVELQRGDELACKRLQLAA